MGLAGYLRRLRALLAALAVLASVPATGVAAADDGNLPAPWVELAADGTLSVRTTVAPGAACPVVTADGVALISAVRSAPDAAFPVTLCEARAAPATRQLSVGGRTVPILAPAINRIAVIGDTGCRVEGKAIQDCNDSAAWPFAAIAKEAAAKRPDLVIHVGDYYYRESACPAGRAGCAGSPHGDTWPTWQAELFDPAAPLLAAAPWIVVRGNHELCGRGGHGWFRLIDPYPARQDCVDRTEPYRLSLGDLHLLVVDDADADDFLAPPDKVAAYAGQLGPFLATAPPHAWLLSHRPFWAMGQGKLHGFTANQTMQQAIAGHIPAALDRVVSGHLHDFISYDFGSERPAQLVVGTGGDTLLPLDPTPVAGSELDGMRVERGFAIARFGYLILERNEGGWSGTLYAPDDSVIARCALAGRGVDCH